VTDPATHQPHPPAAAPAHDAEQAPELEHDPEANDAELERLEADMATIEAAMDRVDAGDLDAATTLMERLDDAPEDDAS